MPRHRTIAPGSAIRHRDRARLNTISAQQTRSRSKATGNARGPS
jgi:hypothetical protein